MKNTVECDFCGEEMDSGDAVHVIVVSLFVRFDVSEKHLKDEKHHFCNADCASKWLREVVRDA